MTTVSVTMRGLSRPSTTFSTRTNRLPVRREYRGRPDEVKQILLDNCNDLGRDRYHQGAGMPNLMKMLMNT